MPTDKLNGSNGVKKGSEAINIIGVELYGKKFSIADKAMYENYKNCYENFVNSLFDLECAPSRYFFKYFVLSCIAGICIKSSKS